MPYKFISLAILIILILACEKEEPLCYLNICDDWEHYTSKAILNSVNTWNANYCYYKTNDDGSLRISLMKTNAYQHWREDITIKLLDWNTGIHELVTGTLSDFQNAEYPIAYFGEGDHDLIGTRYLLLEGEGISNYVNITEISPDSSEISGTYNMSFYRPRHGPGQVNQSIPDTLHFTNGVFKARKWK